MTPENFSGKEFLTAWKEFRKSLPTDDEAIDMVAEFWSRCPTVSRTFDPYDCGSWPSAWELIDSGLICQNGLALGMAYTIVLSDPSWEDRVELAMTDTGDEQILLVIIDNQHVLNYSYDKKESIEKINIKSIEVFNFDGKGFKIKEAQGV